MPLIKNPDSPWSMVFLIHGDVSINEYTGRIIRFRNEDKVAELPGLSDIHVDDQGKPFDVRLHPDFINSRLLYSAYNSQFAGIK